MYDQFMSNSIYNVIADYERYVSAQEVKGEKAVSFINYALGNF